MLKDPTVDNPLYETPRDEHTELEALTQVLGQAAGFTLALARVQTHRHRQRLEGELRARLAALRPQARLHTLELQTPIPNLLEVLKNTAAAERPDVLFVSGLEGAFEDLYSDEGGKLLHQLNTERDWLGSALSCAVVIWVSPPLLKGFLVFAPKLVRDLARIYCFTEWDPQLMALLHTIYSARIEQFPELNLALKERAGRGVLEPELSTETWLELVNQSFFKWRSQRQDTHLPKFQFWPRPSGLSSLSALGAAAWRSRSYELGLLIYDKIARIAAEGEHEQVQIEAHLHLGKLYRRLGQIPHALDSYRFALMQAKRFRESLLAERAAAGLQELCVLRASLPPSGRKSPPTGLPGVAVPLSGREPTRESMKVLLAAVLITESDFDFFCTERFVEFSARHSMHLSREFRTEQLLHEAAPAQVLIALGQTDREAVKKHGHLLRYEQKTA